MNPRVRLLGPAPDPAASAGLNRVKEWKGLGGLRGIAAAMMMRGWGRWPWWGQAGEREGEGRKEKAFVVVNFSIRWRKKTK